MQEYRLFRAFFASVPKMVFSDNRLLQNCCWLTIFLLFLVIEIPCVAAVQEQNLAKTEIERRSSDPYCGLYCLYTVMKTSGISSDFKNLLKPEYISSRKGSSIAELKKAAEDNGLYAEPAAKLTSSVLRLSQHPVVLHVKSSGDKKEYDHYELYLGTQNGQARLFDPPNPVQLIPFRELAPRWDGTGLIVSSVPIDLSDIFAPARKRFMIYASIAVAIILMVRWGRGRWLKSLRIMSRHKLIGLSMAQGASLAILALLLGIVYHFSNDEGFLAHANATTSLQKAHKGNFIPKVSKNKVERLLGSNTVFIDARLARDFNSGHIEGAISVPVDANDTERYKATAGIAKDAPIVIYCQSAGCKFAEKVTIKLKSDGFRNISIFRGGWYEWVAK